MYHALSTPCAIQWKKRGYLHHSGTVLMYTHKKSDTERHLIKYDESNNCRHEKLLWKQTCVLLSALPVFLNFVFLFPSTPSPYTLAFCSQFAMDFICFKDLLKVSLCHLFSSAIFYFFRCARRGLRFCVHKCVSGRFILLISYCSECFFSVAFVRAFIFCRNLICGNCLTCIPKVERNYHWIYSRTNEITFAFDYYDYHKGYAAKV